MSKKAQLAVIDAIIAIFIVISLVISIVFIWGHYLVRLDNKIDFNRMQEKTFQITNNFVKTPGIPTAWEIDPANVRHIGLATKDRILSADKVNNFTNLPYNTIKSLLKIDHYGYNFYFNISIERNSRITGLEPEADTSVINLQRLVLYKNKTGEYNATMQFALWK